MSNPHFRRRQSIAALLIDISGTLHINLTPTPDAVNAFKRLRESSVPFRLCSNTSKESSASLVGHLEKMGFEVSLKNRTRDTQDDKSDVGPRLVWTSLGAVAQVIKSMNLTRPLLLLSESARQEVLEQLSYSYEDFKHSSSKITSRDYDSVVIGLAPTSFDYNHLNIAFRVLKGEQNRAKTSGLDRPLPAPAAPLIATHKAKYIQTEDGLSLGPGPFVAALENATGTTAHVVGKPTKAFFQMVMDDFSVGEISSPISASATSETTTSQTQPSNLRRGKIAIIGDDVEADLGGGALEHDFWRVLVRTGKYRPGDEKRPGIVPPDEVHESFATFIDSLLQN